MIMLHSFIGKGASGTIVRATFFFLLAAIGLILLQTPLVAADAKTDSYLEACTYSYSNDKKAIAVDCADQQYDLESRNYILEGSYWLKSVGTYELTVKKGEGDNAVSCESQIKIGSKANTGVVSGNFATGILIGANTLYSCEATGSATVDIGVRKSNDDKRQKAALAALLDGMKGNINTQCKASPPMTGVDQGCKDDWNTALTICHNSVWTRASTSLLDAINPYYFGNKMTEVGKTFYRNELIKCLAEVKNPVTGASLIDIGEAQIGALITPGIVDAVALAGATAQIDEESTATEPPAEQDPVCSAGALGWVICPAMSIMADVIQWVSGVLEGYLAFNPFAGSSNDIKTIWTSLLNVANLLLIVAFLIVVFSQSTSVGLSNYGIKRMLPRIIAAAILMNLSYYICQILIDLSNIAGVGVTSLVSATSGSTFSDNVEQVGGFSKLLVGAGIIVIVGFFFLVPVMLSFLAIIFTIAARNALLVLLVIVAPLAFAAWILPNTEKYFKKWWELFFNLLILYPLVMLMFSASIVAANVISSTEAPDATGGQELQGLIALLVLTLPLFALPFLFKVAGGALGKINDMTRKGLEKGAEKSGANKLQKAAGEKAGRYAKFGALGAAGAAGLGYNKTLGKTRAGGAFGRGVTRVGRGTTQGWRKIQAADKYLESLDEGRKKLREKDIEGKTGDMLMSDGASGKIAQSYAGTATVAAAIAHQREEGRKRVSSNQQLLSYRERGLDESKIDPVRNKGEITLMYDKAYAEAAAKGDHETAAAVLKNVHVKGAPGREQTAELLEKYAISGETAQKEIEETVYRELSLPNRADITKGEMGTDGKWKLKPVIKLGTEHIASLDRDTMLKAMAAGQITHDEARRIIGTPALVAKVNDNELVEKLKLI